MTYFKIGNYQHPNGEVFLTRHEAYNNYSARDERVSRTHRLHISGQIIADTAAEFLSRANELNIAYANDYETVGLYNDDGTPTTHVLDTTATDNLSGNKIEYLSWNTEDPAELATHRSFSAVIRATFDFASSEIMHFAETITRIGATTGRYVWVITPVPTHLVGVPPFQTVVSPIRQLVSQFTPQTIIQYGHIVGWSTYPFGNVPPPVFPQYEQPLRRQIVTHRPKWHGNQHREYGVSWRYVMQLYPPAFPLPTVLS